MGDQLVMLKQNENIKYLQINETGLSNILRSVQNDL